VHVLQEKSLKIFFAFILMFVGNEALETTKVIELTHAVSKATYSYLSKDQDTSWGRLNEGRIALSTG
jgi:hypothetical protein